MWIERYIIVVATLRVPQMPWAIIARYFPTWVEIGITAGLLALFALIIAVFVKLFPVLSIWELEEQEAEPAIEPVPARVAVEVAG